MKNKEKFKEVFGVECYDGFCPHALTTMCISHTECESCSAYNWTEQEYTGKEIKETNEYVRRE